MKEYRSIFVFKETHERFKKESEKEGRTFDKFLNILLDNEKNTKKSSKDTKHK